VGISDESEVAAFVEELQPLAVITTQERAAPVLGCLATIPYDVPLITCDLCDPQASKADGLLGYLTKPVSAEAIRAIVTRMYADREMAVLVVDDEPDAVRLLESLITAVLPASRVLKAYDGESALRMLGQTAPDLVFMDLVLPGLNGDEVVAEMQASPHLSGVPVVMVTGQDLVADGEGFGQSLGLHHSRDIGTAQGVRYLSALLGAVTPSYLGESQAPESPAGGRSGESASEAPQQRPEPEQALAG
jgi:CheY-like chemotaxis protein